MNPSSNRRLNLTIDGTPYTVEIDDLDSSPLTVTVNGQKYQVQIAADKALSLDGKEAAAVTPVPGAPAAVPTPRKSAPAPVTSGADEVIAPMPGDILDIQVKPGDRVEVGDQICSLEAMKMKSAIRSARAGTIASVEVSEGQAVAHGDVLVTFERG